jgi:hypothetical protein
MLWSPAGAVFARSSSPGIPPLGRGFVSNSQPEQCLERPRFRVSTCACSHAASSEKSARHRYTTDSGMLKQPYKHKLVR